MLLHIVVKIVFIRVNFVDLSWLGYPQYPTPPSVTLNLHQAKSTSISRAPGPSSASMCYVFIVTTIHAFNLELWPPWLTPLPERQQNGPRPRTTVYASFSAVDLKPD